MKTARFSDVVDRCGRPENHLLLTSPDKDRALQTAIKQQRVLTVHREHVGTRKDYGIVGFKPEAHAQYLVFPRSLKDFAGRRIVGVRYELLAEEPPAKPRPKARRESPRSPSPVTPARPAPAHPPPPSRRPAAPKPRPAAPTPKAPRAKATSSKSAATPRDDAAPKLAALLHAVESALAELEHGQAVPAYKRLQRAVTDARSSSTSLR